MNKVIYKAGDAPVWSLGQFSCIDKMGGKQRQMGNSEVFLDYHLGFKEHFGRNRGK